MKLPKTRKIEFEIDDNGCFNCTSHKANKDGYRQIVINKKLYIMHRFIYEQCFGEIPEGLVIRHKCDNTHCINPEHLEPGTPADNHRDMVERGRNNPVKGSEHGKSKLSEEDVYNILKDIRSSNLSLSKIANKYGVETSTVFKVKKGITWSHLHLRYRVILDVEDERVRQDAKWSIQRHDYGTWLQILVEEVGEVAQAMQTKRGWGKLSDADDLYKELIHVAAVATAIAEQVLEEREKDEQDQRR
jgi:NTP pyrophosphatase (non-canonical NTP hydrolase)